MYLSKGCKCEEAVLLCLCFFCYFLFATALITDPTEVDALRTIKRSLIDTNGNLSNWDRGDPCTSNWTGVMCSDTTLVDGYLHVRELQLDNNNFDGNSMPESYANMSKLLKLNCNLKGPIPDFSRIPHLTYLDLSFNQLNESIPTNKLSDIDLSNNKFNGTIPTYFSSLPRLQKLSVPNNSISGTVPSTIWQNRTLNATEELILYMQHNQLTSISGSTNLPPNLTLMLEGNPVCSNNNSFVQFCGREIKDTPSYEYNVECISVAPLIVHYRLKSPGFSDFRAYVKKFENFLTDGLSMHTNQLFIERFTWEEGRLRMNLKLFPEYVDNTSSREFSTGEVIRIRDIKPKILQEHRKELNNLCLFPPRRTIRTITKETLISHRTSPVNETVILKPVGLYLKTNHNQLTNQLPYPLFLSAIACALTLSAVVSILILRIRLRDYRALSKRRNASRISLKVEGVRSFDYKEMALGTNNFSESAQIGEGGYGKPCPVSYNFQFSRISVSVSVSYPCPYLRDFLTEIELLSRLHHRNLVSLIGYCDEEGEQMLVYEYMPNGTLRDHLSAYSKDVLSFSMRLKIALGSAKGLLYLHTEANPPIFHRDVKASNILLDCRYTAKVADFGLSRLAPVPDIEGNVPAHVSTVGYLDPEYFLTRNLTDKSDVYSLGVVFLELLTGRPPIFHGENIIRQSIQSTWFNCVQVNMAYQSGGIYLVVDKRIESYPFKYAVRFFTLALKCCKDLPDERPKMAEVARELEYICSMLLEPDSKGVEYVTSDSSGTILSSQPSSSTINTHFISGDVSSSDLASGSAPTIKPR
ncbi:hypothetical protein PHAVU_008G245000 [Phaseolus vulgaris]|uniref:non-specific serine/threonine protein kinase n=1 Tax=Phaseolus vulgaris TaxID=3885 RepID=V7B8U6_PHAVU|nr:hypothetical protein PHAVU_008G245000g [Phaseolus vulgaris]ESW14005.1 hypothetical protein PHAVU_008G245000g [Phaseolus vulgaris]